MPASRPSPARIDVIPFESEHRFMATLHHDHAGHAFVFVKGAPERVIGMCARHGEPARTRPIDPAYWQARIDALAAEGDRVLALATAPMAKGSATGNADVEGGLTLLGMAGIMDPPREGRSAPWRPVSAAGIRVKDDYRRPCRDAAAIAAQRWGWTAPTGR